jgi:multidrug resistance efflux pump
MQRINARANANENASNNKEADTVKSTNASAGPSSGMEFNTNKMAGVEPDRNLHAKTSQNNQTTTGYVEAVIGGNSYQLKAINGMQIHIQMQTGANAMIFQEGDFLRVDIHSKLPQVLGQSTDVRLDLLACVVTANSRESQIMVCQIESLTPLDQILLRELAAFVDHPAPEQQSAPHPKDEQSIPSQVNKIIKKSKLIKAFTLCGGSLIFLIIIKTTWSTLSTIQIDNAVVAIPPSPVEAIVDNVTSKNRGQIAKIFVREGMAVAPGQALFSTRHDPRIDLDLVDRTAARDLANLNAELRDNGSEISSLDQRIALEKVDALSAKPAEIQAKTLYQQVLIAKSRLERRRELWREGAISQDIYEEGISKLNDIEFKHINAMQSARQAQAQLQHIPVLEYLRRQKLQQRQALLLAREKLQQGQAAQAVLSRQHPLPTSELSSFNASQMGVYRSSVRGVVLRILKSGGDAVQEKETVLVIQRDQIPPTIIAKIPPGKATLVKEGNTGNAEIPFNRQRYPVRLLNKIFESNGTAKLRLQFLNLQANDIRQVVNLAGMPVRVSLPNQNNILEQLWQWLNPRNT